MSIYLSGTFSRSGGLSSAIGKQVRLMNLKGVKRVTVKFDPFAENVNSTRDILFFLSTPRVNATNPKCIVKTDVVGNNSKPELNFSFIESVQDKFKVKEVKLIADNLSTLELLKLCNKHVSAIAPEEEVVTKVQTKSEKKQAAGARRIVRKK